jgi:hypothetical protein
LKQKITKKQSIKIKMPGNKPVQSNNGKFSLSFLDQQLNRYRKASVSQPQTIKNLSINAGLYLLHLPSKVLHFLIDWFKVYEPRWRTTLALIVLIAIISTTFFVRSSLTQAASYTFTQTSWSGGLDAGNATHPTNQSNWDKYSAQTNIDFGTAGALKTSETPTNFSETFTTTTYRDATNTSAAGSISATHLTIGDNASGGPDGTTASISPTANALILVTVGRYATGAVSTPNSVTGNGITYELVASSPEWDESVPPNEDRKKLFLYRGMSASPSAGAITIEGDGGGGEWTTWTITEITGVDTSGSNGSGAVVQSNSNAQAGTSLSISLNAFGSASNGTFATAYSWAGNQVTPEAGWSELTDGNTVDRPQTMWRANNDTTPSWTFSSDAVGGIAVEIRAASIWNTSGQISLTPITPSFIKSASNILAVSNGSTITASFGSNVTAGNAIALWVMWIRPIGTNTLTLTSVTGCWSGGASLVNNHTSGDQGRSALGYVSNVTGGACTITATFNASMNSNYDVTIIAHEVSGIATTDPYDGSTIQTQDSPGTGANALTSGNIITTSNGDYIFAATGDTGYSSTATAGTNYTGRVSGDDGTRSEDRIQAAAGSIAGTFTTSDGFAIFLTGVLALKAASSSGTAQSLTVDSISANIPTATLTKTDTKNIENVSWTSKVNTTSIGNNLTATDVGSGAISSQTITSGDGYVEFTATETNKQRGGGLSNGNSNNSWADIDFGILLTAAGAIRIMENDVEKTTSTYSASDVLRVSSESGQIKYYKNGGLLYTSASSPTYPLLFDTSFDTTAATITNAKIASGPYYYLSNNGGSNWELVTPGVLHTFGQSASDLRFRVILGGNATVQDVTVSFSGFSSTADLTSNAYNTTDATNLTTKLAWSSSGTTGSRTIRFQIRSAPNSGGSPGAWSEWCGYDDCSGTNYFESEDNDVTLGGSHPLRSGANDQWFQYKVFFETDGAGTATLTDVTVHYVVNSTPSFEANPTASQISNSGSADYGKVVINYSIRDTDTDSGTSTPGFVTPSFEYNIGGGWNAITEGNLGGSDLNNKAVDDVSYTAHTATWNAKAQIPTNYTATAQVRVTINDNEAANNTATATSANFTLDTNNPSVTVFTMNSATDAITLTASDDTNLEYRISNNSNLTADGVNGTSGQWQSAGGNSINITPAWTFAGTPNEQVYAEVRDLYGNVTAVSAKAPVTLIDLDLKDISNEEAENFREFLSWGLYSSVAGATFANYKVYRSTDGSSFNLVSTITDININYYADFSLNSSNTYYYKVAVTDSDGDIGGYSATKSDQPNGQGGTDTTPPAITAVTVAETQATYVRITWTTDELSDSRVDYSISPSTAFGSGQTHGSFVTSHSITLTGLTPDTDYLFRARSLDVLSNTGTNDNSGAGFSFSTGGGPLISGVTQQSVNENSARIFWNTDTDSDSFVSYSTNADLSSPTRVGSVSLVGGSGPLYQHTVDLTNLAAGTTYYYFVESTDALTNYSKDTNGDNYYSFRTTTDTEAPVIMGIETPVIAPTAAVVVWQTDELATTQLIWGTVPGVYPNITLIDDTLSIFHIVSLTGLAENTGYYFKAKSKDEADNETTSAEDDFITGATTIIQASGGGGTTVINPPPDIKAPVISNVQVAGIDAFGAQISFEIDEDSVGFVQYGKEEEEFELTAGKADYAKTQSIELDGLRMGTDYFYQVKAVDKGGNVSTSEVGTFTTEFFTESDITFENAAQFREEVEAAIESALPSLVPPFIERPQATEITDSTAKITWRTNIAAFSVVTYAPENLYNQDAEKPYQIEVSNTTEKLRDHEILLQNLDPNTRYHFRVKSFSIPRSIGQSNDLTFVTKALNIQAQIRDIGNSSFRASWRTTEPTSSVVEYRNTRTGVLNQKSVEELATSHEILIDGLTPATTYEVSVYGTNDKGNKVQTANAIRVTTSQDVTPPEITSLKIDTAIVPGRADRTQTIISWKTNEPANSIVYYEEGTGTSADLETLANKVEITNSYVLDHAMVISALKPGGIYRIQVGSTDDAGNNTILPIKTIVVPRESESILDVIFKNFEDTFKFLRQIGN